MNQDFTIAMRDSRTFGKMNNYVCFPTRAYEYLCIISMLIFMHYQIDNTDLWVLWELISMNPLVAMKIFYTVVNQSCRLSLPAENFSKHQQLKWDVLDDSNISMQYFRAIKALDLNFYVASYFCMVSHDEDKKITGYKNYLIPSCWCQKSDLNIPSNCEV